MGSVFLCLVLMSSVCFGNASTKIIDMECQTAIGVVGQTTRITCAFRTSSDVEVNIYKVALLKGQKQCFVFTRNESGPKTVTGDPRFTFVQNEPSLLLSNTSVSDEGEYMYKLATNKGVIEGKEIYINVTAKFNTPAMSSTPEQVENGQKADLYCSSSGGYPVGTIHWFDHTGTNWTDNSKLETRVGKDQLLNLTSKLSFTNIDTLWAPFTCLVLNSKGIVEEKNTLHIKLEGDYPKTGYQTNPQTTNIIAAVVVIGSLTVGLLLLLLLRRRRAQQHVPVAITDPEQGSEN